MIEKIVKIDTKDFLLWFKTYKVVPSYLNNDLLYLEHKSNNIKYIAFIDSRDYMTHEIISEVDRENFNKKQHGIILKMREQVEIDIDKLNNKLLDLKDEFTLTILDLHREIAKQRINEHETYKLPKFSKRWLYE